MRAPKRRLSLRSTLLVLALVPCLALVALGAVNSSHLYGDWQAVHDRTEEGKRFGNPLATVFFNLQAERRLSAAALAESDTGRSELTRQRALTDKSVRSLDAVGTVPSALAKAFQEVTLGLKKLPAYRDAVDRRSADQQQTFDAYTGVIASSMQLFEDFGNVSFAETAVLTRPALDAQWGLEMISREDAIIIAGVASGRLTGEQRFAISELIGSQQHIFGEKVVPQLSEARAKAYQDVLSGADWKRKTSVEQSLLTTTDADDKGRTAVSAALGKTWQQSIAEITPQLLGAGNAYSEDLAASTDDELDSLTANMIVNSAVSASVVLLMLFLSLRLTGTLRRRIFGLRAEALELQERLPDIVERLRGGEKVDTDAELPEICHGDDELGQLGQALNQARGSALETAVREVELYRGFERLLQRIARRTQLLIGMQLKRLGEMQRRHEDPEVLEGLFDLDHLTARLRRYEENLVILGNGTPQRRWRRPVLLRDILRSAQGEVQDYRRIRIDSDGETWLSERAVGPMVHLLAELMENAVSFSRPPNPVEVTASRVGRGVAIEIEDRGMGMDPEQYAEANQLMAAPPRMDVMSRADDARLGLYVVARLAANLGIRVELRPSSFGGTRVVVLVPAELVSAGGPVRGRPAALPAAPEPLAPPAAPVPARLALHSTATRSGPTDTSTRPATPAVPAPDPHTLRGTAAHTGPADANTRPATPGVRIPDPHTARGTTTHTGPTDTSARPATPAVPAPDPHTLHGTTTHTRPADATTRPAPPAVPPAADPHTVRGTVAHTGSADADGRAVPRSRAVHVVEQEAYARPLIGPWAAPSAPPARPTPPSAQAPAPAPTASQNPLPRRVRQASLATELREAPPSYDTEPQGSGPSASAQPLPRRGGTRSGATVGAFQRQSRAARLRPDADHQPSSQPTNPSPGPDRARKEDGR
ncbi:hypothetical protein GCM10023084_76130 [Streptomyces lacrimifluminis]|uniref:histidine kinase n=1 Tax=Streptomyces lacrimifluminis TaxID=1500077 RepID=A0A917ULK9_9ACTN|nr:nitrate- and nitrite sensing domain-containing protein [Streptomyces lacrimifluminis]GGJ66499.1 histidine kinase [Streptomyces lacrimifluminis]